MSKHWRLVVILLFAAGAQSQTKPTNDAAQPPEPLRIGTMTVTGSWRVRVESWDWFQDGLADSTYTFPHSIFRLSIGQQGDKLDWLAEMSQATVLNLPTNAVAPSPQGQLGLGASYFVANSNHQNNAGVFLKQAFVRIKAGHGVSVRLGRFEFLDGGEVKSQDATLATLEAGRISQRLIGPVGWSAVQRSFDGIHLVVNQKQNNFTLVAARPTQGVYQVHGLQEVDVGFIYGAYTRQLQSRLGPGEVRVFALGYEDVRGSVLKTDNRPAAARRTDRGDIKIGTYGGNYLQVLPTAGLGSFDFLVWGVVQTGSWGRLQHRAGAFVGEAGWQPPMKHLAPWLSAGYSYGSGDGNPNDNRHTTFFQVLPTSRPYARFPFFDMENSQDAYGTLSLRPHSRLTLRSEMHWLRLSSREDLWYLGGGAYQPSTFGYTGRPSGGHRGLANLVDLSADYQVTRNFGLGLYYGKALGHSVIASIYPQGKDGQFGYVETNVRF